MSGSEPHYELSDRIPERPGFDLGKTLSGNPSALLLRFVAGALASVVSGSLALVFGARIAGIPLAFPAVLVASLTLIEEQEDSQEAREDSRGAMAGAAALALFGVVAALLFTVLPGGLVLILAGLTWLAVSVGMYRLFWWTRRASHG